VWWQVRRREGREGGKGGGEEGKEEKRGGEGVVARDKYN